jgi:hypothetical protein
MVAAAVVAGVTSAAALGGAAISSKAASKASKAQVQASQDANAAQERMFQKQMELQEPFRQGGITAQDQIMQLLGIGGDKTATGYGSLGKAFGQTDFEQDPGYAFRQAEGMKALERSAAARGMLSSGSTLKGIQRFGQDLASQEYQNAFNRYQIERNAKLNPLQSLMGAGQSATNVMTGAAGQMGQNEASNLYNAGTARASGYIGQGNALTNALGQIGATVTQIPMNNAIMNYYNRTPATSSSSTPRVGVAPQAKPVFGYDPMLPRNPYLPTTT